MSYYADSNGTKIYYQIRGEDEPLILLMGFGADGNVWEKHVAEYEKHFKCFILDNRGVGLSDPSRVASGGVRGVMPSNEPNRAAGPSNPPGRLRSARRRAHRACRGRAGARVTLPCTPGWR